MLKKFPFDGNFSLKFAPFEEIFGSIIQVGFDYRALQKKSFQSKAFANWTK